MIKSRSYIARILMMVYAISFLMVSLPVSSFAGIEIKKKCLRKEMRMLQTGQVMANPGQTAELSDETSAGEIEISSTAEICTSSVYIPVILDESQAASFGLILKQTDRFLCYLSPILLKIITPPKLVK